MLLFSLVLICCQGRSQERVQGVPEILFLCINDTIYIDSYYVVEYAAAANVFKYNKAPFTNYKYMSLQDTSIWLRSTILTVWT